MPELRRLLIGDDPQSWEAAGFTVSGGETRIGNIAVRFVDSTATDGRDRKAVGWELSGLQNVGDGVGGSVGGSVGEDVGEDVGDGVGGSVGDGVGDNVGEDVGDGAAARTSVDGIETVITQHRDAAGKGGSPAAEPVEQQLAHRNRVSRMDHVVIMTPDVERTISSLQDFGFATRRTRDIPGADPPRRQVFLWAGEAILEVVGPVTATGSGPAAVWGLALTTDDMDAAIAELGAAISAPKDAVQPGRKIATIKTKDLGVSIALALMTPHVPPEEGTTSGSADA